MLLVSAISLGALALYGRRFFGRVPAALPYSLLMAAAAFWALVYAFEILAGSLSFKVLFHDLRFLVIPYIPFLELWLVLMFVGKTAWLRRDRAACLLVIPVLAMVIGLTSPFHTLFRFNFSVSMSGPVPVLQYSDGLFYVLYMIYSLVILIAAYGVLLYESRKQGTLLHAQTILLFIALGFPTVLNYLFVVGITPVAGVNMTAPLLWIAAVLYTLAIFRFRFLDIIPVARGRLIETMSTLMLVLDGDDRVIDMNPAARRFFAIPPGTKAGMNLGEVVRDWPELLALCRSPEGGRAELIRSGTAGVQTFMVTADPFPSPSGKAGGRLVLLQDVTGQKTAEQALREMKDMFEGMLDGITDIIGLQLPDHTILRYNLHTG